MVTNSVENICPKCGKPRFVNDIECPYCGIVYTKFKIKHVQPINQNADVLPSIAPIYKNITKKSIEFFRLSKKEWVGVLLIIGLGLLFYVSKILGSIAIVGLVLYWIEKNRKDRVVVKSPIKMKVDVSPYRFLGDAIPDIVIKIKSSSRNTEYLVNPKNQTCTCPDFVDFRSQFKYGDVRRFCKHIMQALCRNEIFDFLPDYLKPLVLSTKEQGKGAYKEQVLFFDLDDQSILITVNDDNAWHSVYSENLKGQYERYSYNTDEKRWSYRKSPRHKKEIVAVILAVRQTLNL